MVLICITCQEWMIVFAQFIEIFSCLELLKMNVILMKWSLYYSKKYSCFYTTAIDVQAMTKQEKVFSPTASIQQYEDSPEILYLSNRQLKSRLIGWPWTDLW